MKSYLKKLFYSFVVLLLVVTTMPLHVITATAEPSNEVAVESVTDEEYAKEKLEIIKLEEEEAKESAKEGTKSKKGTLYSYDTNVIVNDFLSIAIGSEGRFSMGTSGGNPNIDTDNNKDLLYGHPSPGTSFTTVRVNGKDYEFYAEDSIIDEENQEIISTQVIDGVEVKQVLEFSTNATTNREDIAHITYELTNKNDEEVSAGTRIMLDTMLGRNDGAPFRVPGIGDVLYETELVGSEIPQYWQAFDNLDDPDVIANGTFFTSANDRPDKVQFVYWRDIYNTLWDYEVSSEKRVTRDSAVAIYHNPETIAPGEKRVVDTYYGIGDFAVSVNEPPFQVRLTAPEELVVDIENANYYSNPYTITGYVRNIGEEVTKDATITLDLPENSGLTLLTPEDPTITLGDLAVGEEKIVTWTVLASSQKEATTVAYDLKINATNTDEKVIPISIHLPEVKGDSEGAISLNKEKLTLDSGESEKLTAELNGITGKVSWFTEDPTIATVTSNGKVTAKSGGETKIIAAAGGKIAEATLTVVGSSKSLEGISFSSETLDLNVNNRRKLDIHFSPEEAANKRVSSWKSSDTSVARVSNGYVTGISQGKATITAVSEEGEYTTSITVEVTEGAPSLNLGDDFTVSREIEGPEIKFKNIGFNAFKIPIDINVELGNQIELVYDNSEDKYVGFFGDIKLLEGDNRKEDGSLTDKSKKVRAEAFKKVKSLVSKADNSSSSDFYNSYRSLIKRDSGFIIKGSVSLIGFVEFVNTEDGVYELGSGQAAIIGKGKIDEKLRFPPFPLVYTRFSLAGSLQAGLDLKLKEAGSLTDGLDFSLETKGKFTPGLSVGAGTDALLSLDVGLEGEVESSLEVPFDGTFKWRNHFTTDLSASLYIEARALLFASARKEYTFAEARLYPRHQSIASFNASELEDDSFKLMSREYAKNPSSFVANDDETTDNETSGLATKVAKENVYPYGSPVITQLKDGKQLLVWVDDVAARSDVNRTALFYSVNDGNIWTEPKQVDDDGTADFEPQLAVHEDDVYVTWQNITKELDENTELEDMVDSLGISVAKFNGETFDASVFLTDSSSIPSSVPKIASNESDISIIWTESNTTDVEDLSNAIRIVESTRTEDGWTTPKVVVEDNQPIVELDIVHAEERSIAYSTEEGIFLQKGDTAPVRIENQEDSHSPTFSDSDLYWYANGEIKKIKKGDENSVQTVLTLEDEIGSFDVLTNGENHFIYFVKEEGFASALYGAYYDKESSKWGEPIELIKDNQLIRRVDGTMQENGEVSFAYHSVPVHGEQINSDEDFFGETNLKITTVRKFTDLGILSNINFDVNEVTPGETIALSFDVGNLGSETIKGFTVDIYYEDDVVFSEEIDEEITSGMEQYAEVNYPLPEDLIEHQLKVKVTPNDAEDNDYSNNEADVTIGESNIEVKKPVVSGEGSTRKVTAEIENIGYKTATNIQVEFNAEVDEDNITFQQTIDRLEPGSSQVVEFEVRINDLKFDPSSSDVLIHVEATGNDEFENGLHHNFTTIENPYTYHELSISEAGIAGNNLIFTIQNNVPEEVGGTVIVQSITNGEIETLGQSMVFDALHGKSMQLDIHKLLNDMEESSMIRLFVVDENDQTISNTINLGEYVQAPQSTPEAGTYTEAQQVILHTETQDADIHFTTDGSEPTIESEVYRLPINVEETTTIKAFAIKSGQTESATVELKYVIKPKNEDGDDTTGDESSGTDDEENPDGESDDKKEGDSSSDKGKNPSDESDDGDPTQVQGENKDSDDESLKEDQSSQEGDKDEDGDNLPKTATNLYNIMLIGTLLLGVGIILSIRRKQSMV